MLECRSDDFCEPVTVLAHDIDAGSESGFLGFGQQCCCSGSVILVGFVELIEQEQIAEVENAGFDTIEVDVGTGPEGVCAAHMEECSASAGDFCHDICVRRGCVLGLAEVFGIDFELSAVGEDAFAQLIFADQAGGVERERGAEDGEIDKHVVWGSAGALALTADVGKAFRLGIDVNHFDLVNDPVAAGEYAGACSRRFCVHNVRYPARLSSCHSAPTWLSRSRLNTCGWVVTSKILG